MKILFLLLAFLLSAEEGMWPFNMVPVRKIENAYGVTLDDAWIERVQKASLRISLGGSGSFVSPQGLILTNHHVGSRAIYNLSSEERDLMEHGFLAKTFEEELPCSNMYVDQLVSIQDVTDEVNSLIGEGGTPATREEKRKATLIDIKQRAQAKTGLQPQIVSLYQGARYHLYLYQRYSDIRLVMAPEKNIAFFGGDLDNFEYPRYDLDLCFFRAYKDGKPLATDAYLPFNPSGPVPSAPLFVSGNPGRTERMFTAANLEFLRDVEFPLLLQWLQQRRAEFIRFSEKSAENQRIACQDIFGFENSIKVYAALYGGLKTGPIIPEKIKAEQTLFKTVSDCPWLQLQAALDKAKSYYPRFMVLEGAGSNYSKLYTWAKLLVRYAAERTKPNEKRLPEYADSELPALKLALLSTEPVYKSLEKVYLEGSFQRTIQILGSSDPVSRRMAGKKKVSRLIDGTALQDLEVRKRLFEHPEEISSSHDPLILLAKAIDPYAREIRKKKEEQLDSVKTESYEKIAKIFFTKYGESIYPDATFSLRLSIGAMKGYEQNGQFIAPTTRIGGAFDKAEAHDNQPPNDLPPSWLATEDAINRKTPFNFVSTNDIIGGNSGSPVIDQSGKLVGLIFDGNVQSLLWDLAYDDKQGRAIAVHSAAIQESLRSVYHADALLKELSE